MNYCTHFDTLILTSDIVMLAANISSCQSIFILPYKDGMDHFPSPSKAHAYEREWSLSSPGIWALPGSEDVTTEHYDSRNKSAPWRTGQMPPWVVFLWLWWCLMFGWIRSLSLGRVSPHHPTFLTEAELIRRSTGNRLTALFHTLGNQFSLCPSFPSSVE